MLGYQGGKVIREHRKSWTVVSGSLVEIRCDGHLHVDFGSRSARLSAVLEQVGGRFEARADSQRAQTSRDMQRPLSLIPSGLEAHAEAAGVLFMRHLVLQFELSEVMPMMQGDIDLTDSLTPRLMFSDPEIMQLAQLFAAECASDEPQPALYGDSLSVALLLALSRLGKSKCQPTGRGHLAPWQLRRVTEYFAAHLADDIRLQQACELISLSKAHFCRAFKLSTGLAPHQWLLRARINKAKQVLLETDCPLAQIAVEVGFSDQAHFTRAFGRVAGNTPGAWQRAHRT